MPKLKPKEEMLIEPRVRSPLEARAAASCAEIFHALARYYGFDRVVLAPLDEARAFQALAKNGLLDERPLFVAKTKAGADVAIAPPGVAGAIRAYVREKMYELARPLKLRFETSTIHLDPASHLAGIREKEELGLVMIDEKGPVAEAEMLFVVWKTLDTMGLSLADIQVQVGVSGCSQCRIPFRAALGSYFRTRAARLCKNCKKNLKKAPTKVFLCADEKCMMVSSRAPQVLDYLCEACKKHLRGFLEFLDELRIPYFLNPKFFRERSLYGMLIFELRMKVKKDESEHVNDMSMLVAEGGRITRASELITGKPVDAVAAIIFPDAVRGAMIAWDVPLPGSRVPRVFLTQLGDLAKKKSLGLIERLRAAGIDVDESLGRDSIKSQLKLAERGRIGLALIFGQKEALDGTMIVRELDSGIQETVPQEKLIEYLRRQFDKENNHVR